MSNLEGVLKKRTVSDIIEVTLSEFRGKPLISVPQNISEVNILSKDYAKSVLSEVKNRYKFPIISKVELDSNGFKNSSPYLFSTAFARL